MERVTNHERPGVYSAYTATARPSGGTGAAWRRWLP